MNQIITRLSLIAAGVAIAGCDAGVDPSRPIETLPRSLSAAEREVIASSNEFAFRLLREVNVGQEEENVFISPLSVSMALGMTMNGARGSTFEEMRATLRFDGLTQAEINTAYSDLLDLLLALDPAVRIHVGNSVWYRDDFPFEESFFATVRRGFRAHVQGLDFADPSAVRTINQWVKDATSGRIDSIVEDIPADAVMYLINAIYFKGAWTDRFDPSRTRNERFTGIGGIERGVRMMSNEGSYRYGWHPDFEVAELPYGNSAFTMTILLPREGRDVNDVLMSLGAAGWDEVVGGLAISPMFIEVPRFRLEYEKGLKESLMAMGMRVPFAPGGADFGGLSGEYGRDLYISEVKHKTFVEVNEEGTEAAAATSVGVRVTSMPPTLRVDRPFLFAIRERFSGTVLFMGKIVWPEEG